MGCDIHTIVERCIDGKYEVIEDMAPFSWRQYGMFGFLANVRNYNAVPPISDNRELPPDISAEAKMWLYDGYSEYHSVSWVTVAELLCFDYDQTFEDRRVTRKLKSGITSGGVTGEPGEGTMTTYREFLGEEFFNDLKELQARRAKRVFFGFDS